MKFIGLLKDFFLNSLLYCCGHCGIPTDNVTEPVRCDDCLHNYDHGGEG